MVAICLGSFWIRISGFGGLPSGQYTETDAYLYDHQARIISEQGHLPGRDLRRWVPLGRDTSQSLNLYPLVLGYVHKSVTFLFSEVRISSIVRFAPVVCFCVGLLVLCVFLLGTEGFGVSVAVGVILATLPGTIERSAYGFGDRDAFCLLLGLSAVPTYLFSLQISGSQWRYLWTLLSGFLMFLGGLSWEGFGVFLCIVLCVEVWRFLSSETEEDLPCFALWVFSFVPALYLASPAYRSGMGWSTHLFSFMLLPPVVLLVLRGMRSWLFFRSLIRETLMPYRRHISLGFLLLTLGIGIVYVLSIRETFSLTTVVFGSTPLMQSIGELAAPHFGYWTYRYGSIFLVGSIGMSLIPVCQWGSVARPLSVSVAFFCVTVFFRQSLASVCGVAMADGLFGCALLAVFGTFIHLGWKLQVYLAALTSVAMLAWAVFWLALARDAKRYDFFIGVPLAYFTAMLIEQVTGWLIAALRDPQWTTEALHAKLEQLRLSTTTLTALLLSVVLLWGPQGGGHLFRAHAAATHLRHATPGTGALLDAYTWMKAHLSERAVVAAEWSYGTQLNVLGGVLTITDPDHYIPYWIHLYRQHVQLAKNEQEALDFLFSHDVTHLMITEKQPGNTLLRSGGLSGVFVPVYPEENFKTAVVKVWELQYPAGIEKRPEYLSTGPKENAHDRQPHHHH